jgi:serine/threonine-protein kinase RsbW
MSTREFVLYGLSHYTEVINDIIYQLNAKDYEFDIKMILNEAIANAFFHGNRSSEELPIMVRYSKKNNNVIFEIEDSGDTEFCMGDTCENSDILSEGNRGLFLIGCYADKIEYNDKTLKVLKSIGKGNS